MQVGAYALPRGEMARTRIVITGAGIIGLSLALELHVRGLPVTVFERARALAQASTAAAGMLAVHDPDNPPALLALSQYSAAAYPAFLQRLERLSGFAVPFQTSWTVQHMADGSSLRISEHSLDPRQLAAALYRATLATSIQLREQQQPELTSIPDDARALVHTTGAWFSRGDRVFPRKGQMLRVQLPRNFTFDEVHRGERVYIVPRTCGPQAGTAVIGATVEDAGFDRTTHAADLDSLRQLAADWIPQIGSPRDAPVVEAWAGTRPATRDGLPLLGATGGEENGSRLPEFVAAGHFRNGILLAPATALVMADLIEGKQPAVDLAPFSPDR